jgi:hypothetical protein
MAYGLDPSPVSPSIPTKVVCREQRGATPHLFTTPLFGSPKAGLGCAITAT